ncbi:rCG51238 [Rattus norvegicus]|uniref:RCG51238 n=1 Tax=Rattus norvegicus TaxID=10116 RepID=A6IZI1_RAT|nr:rCG51238 [Rattus norvegicus]
MCPRILKYVQINVIANFFCQLIYSRITWKGVPLRNCLNQ